MAGESVTPYIHVIAYDFGYYLEHHRSIERYANYAIFGRTIKNPQPPKKTKIYIYPGFAQGRNLFVSMLEEEQTK